MAAAAHCKKNEKCIEDENTPVLYKMMGIELTRNLRFLAQVMKADRVLGIAGEMVGNRTSLFQYVDL